MQKWRGGVGLGGGGGSSNKEYKVLLGERYQYRSSCSQCISSLVVENNNTTLFIISSIV